MRRPPWQPPGGAHGRCRRQPEQPRCPLANASLTWPHVVAHPTIACTHHCPGGRPLPEPDLTVPPPATPRKSFYRHFPVSVWECIGRSIRQPPAEQAIGGYSGPSRSTDRNTERHAHWNTNRIPAASSTSRHRSRPVPRNPGEHMHAESYQAMSPDCGPGGLRWPRKNWPARCLAAGRTHRASDGAPLSWRDGPVRMLTCWSRLPCCTTWDMPRGSR